MPKWEAREAELELLTSKLEARDGNCLEGWALENWGSLLTGEVNCWQEKPSHS